jgi:hypothetical protein
LSCQTVKGKKKTKHYFEFHGLNVMAANVQGLAMWRNLKNVLPGTADE